VPRAVQAAGLAVTSSEQRGMPPFKWNILQNDGSAPPPTPRKDKKWTTRTSDMNLYGVKKESTSTNKARQPFVASGSTGITVLGFTPHEKTYTGQSADGPRSRASPEFTEVFFTPPHEQMYQPLRSPPEVPKRPMKKPFPWLRTPVSSPEESSIPRKASDALSTMDGPQSPSRPRDSFSSCKSMRIYEGKFPVPTCAASPRHSTHIPLSSPPKDSFASYKTVGFSAKAEKKGTMDVAKVRRPIHFAEGPQIVLQKSDGATWIIARGEGQKGVCHDSQTGCRFGDADRRYNI